MNRQEYSIDIDGFKKYLQSQKLAERSVLSYIDNISQYSRRFDTFSYYNNKEIVETYIEADKSKATINKYITSINKYIDFLISNGEPIDDWKLTHEKIKTVQFIDDILSMADYEFLLKKAYANEEWLVYLYARIAGTTGMRLCEMLQIKREHIEHGCVDLYGKGAKRRRIYFPKTMKSDILKLLDKLRLQTGYVFSPHFNGKTKYASYGRYIQAKLSRFGEECELPKGLLHAHEFRHFFAKEFIKKNPNISLLADLLGHSNLNTTRIYLKLTSKEQAEELDKTVTW